jgi:hypothetical protein
MRTPSLCTLIPFAKATHVDVEIVNLSIVSNLVLEKMGILKRIHTAGARAVLVVVYISAADTMKDRHALRRLGELEAVVGIAFQELASRRSCSV